MQTKIIAGLVILLVAVGAAYYLYGTSTSGTLQVMISDPPKDWGAATDV